MKKPKPITFRPRLCRWRCKCGVGGFAYDPIKEINAHVATCELHKNIEVGYPMSWKPSPSGTTTTTSVYLTPTYQNWTLWQ